MKVELKTVAWALGIFLALAGLCIFFWVNSVLETKNDKIDALRNSIDVYDKELQGQIRDNIAISDSLEGVYSKRLDSVRSALSNDALRAHIIDSLKNNQYDTNIDTMRDLDDIERTFTKYYPHNAGSGERGN